MDVELVSVTFVETQVRAGQPPNPAMLPALPAILGNGVGGTVAGRRVVSSLGGTGGYAERAVAPAGQLIEVPDGVPLRDAVALLADGRTAMALTGLAAPRAGDTVVVEAAAGGVGTLLVQLARNAGARVVALAGSEPKLALARELGADVAVSYAQAGWEQRVRDAAGEADVVFDGVGGSTGAAAFGLLRAGGRFCPFGMASGRFAPVPPDLAAARQVSVLRGGDPRRRPAHRADARGPGPGRRGPDPAGHRAGARPGPGRRRARRHRGPRHHRQDAADRAPVTGTFRAVRDILRSPKRRRPPPGGPADD